MSKETNIEFVRGDCFFSATDVMLAWNEGDPPIASFVEMTSREAANIVDSYNKKNRNVSHRWVMQYTRDMGHGDWAVNGDSVVLGWDEDRESFILLDGQKRLIACTRSDTSFRTLFVVGADVSAQLTMDLGQKRTISDNLMLSGAKWSSPHNVSVVRVFLAYPIQDRSIGFSTATIEFVYETFKDCLDFAFRFSRKKKINSHVCAAIARCKLNEHCFPHLTTKEFDKRIETFVGIVSSLEMSADALKGFDSAKLLHNFLHKPRPERLTKSSESGEILLNRGVETYQKTQVALTHFLFEGRKIRALVGSKRDLFPVPLDLVSMVSREFPGLKFRRARSISPEVYFRGFQRSLARDKRANRDGGDEI